MPVHRNKKRAERLCENESLLTPDHASEALGIGRDTLARWIREANVEYLRVEGSFFITQSDLQLLFNRRNRSHFPKSDPVHRGRSANA